MCELVNDERLYGFMVLVLDEENTVFSTGFRTSNKRGCGNWKKSVERVLSRGSKIKLIGMGDLVDPRVIDKNGLYNFTGLGTFPSNGRVLQLMSLANENGDCFSFFDLKCGKESYF